jgi:hypothetical protein
VPFGSSVVVAAAAGSSWAFVLALGAVLVWALTGPVLHFSDTWQFTINTGPTNRDIPHGVPDPARPEQRLRGDPAQAERDLGRPRRSQQRLINVEELPEAQVRALAERYRVFVALAEGDVASPTASHSIEETVGRRADG